MSDFADIEIVEDSTHIDPSDYLADVATKLVSGVLGLMAFATASIIGLLAGNPGLVILGRAIVAMIICAIVGRLLGAVGEICVHEFVTRYKTDRPEPIKPKELVELDMEQEAHESVKKRMKKAA